MRLWLWLAFVVGLLAGSVLWDLRAAYAPLAPQPQAARLGAPLPPAEQRGFLVLVPLHGNRCSIVDARERVIARFACEPVGRPW